MEFLHLFERLEKQMSALTDAVTALKTAVDANTAAVASVPSSADAAAATAVVNEATAQLVKNNTTLAGDVAPAV
jgi:hypothetical protein